MSISFESLTDAQLGKLYDRWQRIKKAGGPLITHERLDWIAKKLKLSSYTPSRKEKATLDYAKMMGLAALNKADADLIEDMARKAITPKTIWEEGLNNGQQRSRANRLCDKDRV